MLVLSCCGLYIIFQHEIECITDIVLKNGQCAKDPRKGPYCSRLVFVRCVGIGVVGTFRSSTRVLITGRDLNDNFLNSLFNDWKIDFKLNFVIFHLSQTVSCEAKRSN